MASFSYRGRMPSAAGRQSPFASMPPGSALVIFTIDSRGAPVGQCTSGRKPLPIPWPNSSLRTSESVIQVGFSQPRVADWCEPERNIAW